MSYYDDASLVVIPSGYKTSKVYAEKPTDGSGDLTFTRTGDTATRVASNGLIEKVRTNLILRSQDFGNASWNVSNLTKTTGQSDPNNGTTGVLLTSTGTSSVYFYQTATGAGCMSVYAKAGTRSNFSLIPTTFTNGAFFNLATQTATASGVGSLAKIESVGGGWFRCSVAVSSSTNMLFSLSDVNGAGAAIGDTMSFAFAQFETGDIATAYIPTTTAAVSVGPVSNVPRLDYLGSSCPRLLLEPQRTNLVTYSEDINNSFSSKVGVTITSNDTTSPDGYASADKLKFDTASGYVLRNQTVAAATAYTMSCFVKNNNFTSGQILTFNMSDGVVGGLTANINVLAKTATYSGSAGAFTSVSGKVEDYGNGWFRVSVTGTSVNGGSGWYEFGAAGVTNSCFVWGFSLEAGAYATSYIPTPGASSVTRLADAYQKAGFGNTSTAGTLYYEFSNYNSPASANGFYMVILFAGSSVTSTDFSPSNAISIINNGLAIEGRNNGYATTLFSFTPTAGATVKVALRYDGTNVVSFVNGTKGTVFTDTSVGVKNALRVNNGENATHASKQLLFFPTALTDAQCIELTTL